MDNFKPFKKYVEFYIYLPANTAIRFNLFDFQQSIDNKI